jgi:polyhydroxybutyrate depolymerase
MPVLHIHGTEDGLVPFEGAKKAAPAFVRFRPVEDNVKMCAKANGCNADPKITELPQSKDAVRILKHDYGKGANGAEVVLYVLDGAGHTWPGRSAPAILGRTTHNLIANEVIWDFFRRYTRE